MTINKYLKWLSGETKSVYWHDGAIPGELDAAIENGATGATTNPVLLANSLPGDSVDWAEKLRETAAGKTGDERAEALTLCVAAAFAEKLRKFSGRPGSGFCCAQVNPNKPGDAEAMTDQAGRYAAAAENIVIKLPATAAGLRVLEECAAKGFNAAATVSFTTAQVLAAGEAFERGSKRAEANGTRPGLGIAVLMVGRLDDYLRDVALDGGAQVTEEDIRFSGLAAIKRAYEIFGERGYRCKIMPAGMRGSYHITELAGADMIMSVFPKIADTLADVPAPFVPGINNPIPESTIKRLSALPEFIKAYEPSGLRPEEFIAYGATNRTLAQFCFAGWDRLKEFK